MLRRSIFACLPCLLLSGVLLAADTHGVTYTTLEAAQADPDFAIQGEYAGDHTGVQVIALGDHKFRTVKFAGGLPGAGWDGSEKVTVEGTWDEVKANVNGLKKTQRRSPTLGQQPAAGAIVLFDGTQPTLKQHWVAGAKMTDDGLLQPGVTSTDTFENFSIHLEFLLPYMPQARGQGRGNSGCYLQGRYEVQILDSFGLKGEDNECGGIYKAAAPSVNMCLPPLVWQTYDIDFTAAKFDADGKKISNARATVKLNGVTIHDNQEIPQGTPGGPIRNESAEAGPIFLQDHGNPVRFRNIWVVRK